jgi:hypothetical protein
MQPPIIDDASRNMAKKHTLEGLIKWSMRDRWADRFEQVLEDHLMPTCEETGLEINDVVAAIGEDLFMSTVWACAFVDFLTREFNDGENAIDDYLRRRGWKESASVRIYMAALRNSTMSLYEVGDIVRGTSFRARDLIRGGEPVLISERSATRALKPWDRIAANLPSRQNRSSKSWHRATSPSHRSSLSPRRSVAPSSMISWTGTTAACSMSRFPCSEVKRRAPQSKRRVDGSRSPNGSK